MPTCGDLDGSGTPCEFFLKGCILEAPSVMGIKVDKDDWACAPVLALLEARKEAAKWKRLVLDGIKEAGERVTDDLREKVKRMMSGEEDP